MATTRRQFLAACALSLEASRSALLARSSEETPTQRGLRFLEGLYNPKLRLLPEYRDSRVYWLYHDNYLAAKLLAQTNQALSAEIDRAIRQHGVTQSGKIEIVFGEARRPLPFRRPSNIDVSRVGDALIRTEVAGDEPLKGWEQYADLRFLAALALAADDPSEAATQLDAGLATWDGLGFHDRVVQVNGQYATYKLALALLAARRLKRKLDMQDVLLQRLRLQQHGEGGWITDYSADGAPQGMANVETTCLVLLGLASVGA